MKKIFLALLIFILTPFCINAQPFTLSIDGVTLGDTITVLPDSHTSHEIAVFPILENNTDHRVNIKLARNEIKMVDTSYSYICFGGYCTHPKVDTSVGVLTIAAGESSSHEDISYHYIIKGTVGVATIEYTCFNVDDPSENVKLIVNYDTRSLGTSENILKGITVSDIYPNPAANFVNLNYNMPVGVEKASIRIINLTGTTVKEQPLDIRNSSVKLSISDISRGCYFYSLFVNEAIYSTKKLIVR